MFFNSDTIRNKNYLMKRRPGLYLAMWNIFRILYNTDQACVAGCGPH